MPLNECNYNTCEIIVFYNFIGAYGFTQVIESVRNTSKKSNELHSR